MYATVITRNTEHVELNACCAKAGDFVAIAYMHGGIARQDFGVVTEVMEENPYGNDDRCGYVVKVVEKLSDPEAEVRKAAAKMAAEAEAAELEKSIMDELERTAHLKAVFAVAKGNPELLAKLDRLAELRPDDAALAKLVSEGGSEPSIAHEPAFLEPEDAI